MLTWIGNLLSRARDYFWPPPTTLTLNLVYDEQQERYQVSGKLPRRVVRAHWGWLCAYWVRLYRALIGIACSEYLVVPREIRLTVSTIRPASGSYVCVWLRRPVHAWALEAQHSIDDPAGLNPGAERIAWHLYPNMQAFLRPMIGRSKEPIQVFVTIEPIAGSAWC